MTDVPDTLHLTVQHPRPGLAIATVAGDMDLHTAETLRRQASDIIEKECPHLVLDLAQVRFCDSAGLSALIGLWHATQALGGALGLADVPDRLMRMLVLTGVDAVLPIHATAAEALIAMTNGLPPAQPYTTRSPRLSR
ncbi:STAS domain-containing protein [Actinospica acidiphila]|uniref:STAS domain-containing protein n=1 Tax=Streptomyces sp. RK31 TaxID=2824892 RepID=UPI0013D53BEE|nr:STAS domain-containing protein [Streptomyces sp. RK31]MBQ0976104.1 STAS domain-containing protein [Streptomyces sp. RK31]NEA82420.1 STAS domain-containing protein [Actinospica acidiphila]